MKLTAHTACEEKWRPIKYLMVYEGEMKKPSNDIKLANTLPATHETYGESGFGT